MNTRMVSLRRSKNFHGDVFVSRGRQRAKMERKGAQIKAGETAMLWNSAKEYTEQPGNVKDCSRVHVYT